MGERRNVNRNQLMKEINEISFAIVDIALYLDTHPKDQDALAYFRKNMELRKELMELYAKHYGPLTLDCAGSNNQWYWSTQPMPWEGGYC